MQKIMNTNIVLTKGDTLKAVVTLDSTGDVYTPEAGDEIRFAMKKDYSSAAPLILKVIPHDTMLLKLNPEDTSGLKVGKYVYDIQITYKNGDVDTFIDRASFTITEEVD